MTKLPSSVGRQQFVSTMGNELKECLRELKWAAYSLAWDSTPANAVWHLDMALWWLELWKPPTYEYLRVGSVVTGSRTWGLNVKCKLHGSLHPEYLCPLLNRLS